MQNLSLSTALSAGELTCPYTPTVLQGFLDLEDFAVVARIVLLNPAAHTYARYELVGQNCALQDVARQLSKATGKEIACMQPPRDMAVEKFVKEKGLTAFVEKDGFERMLFYYDKRSELLAINSFGKDTDLRCPAGFPAARNPPVVVGTRAHDMGGAHCEGGLIVDPLFRYPVLRPIIRTSRT